MPGKEARWILKELGRITAALEKVAGVSEKQDKKPAANPYENIRRELSRIADAAESIAESPVNVGDLAASAAIGPPPPDSLLPKAAHDRLCEELFRRNESFAPGDEDLLPIWFTGEFEKAMQKAGFATGKLPVRFMEGGGDTFGLGEKIVFAAKLGVTLNQAEVGAFLKTLPGFRKRRLKFIGDAPKIHGLVAALSITKAASAHAAANGLFVLTQTKQGDAEVHNARGFKPRAF